MINLLAYLFCFCSTYSSSEMTRLSSSSSSSSSASSSPVLFTTAQQTQNNNHNLIHNHRNNSVSNNGSSQGSIGHHHHQFHHHRRQQQHADSVEVSCPFKKNYHLFAQKNLSTCKYLDMISILEKNRKAKHIPINYVFTWRIIIKKYISVFWQIILVRHVLITCDLISLCNDFFN